jgi:hypothetical protein
MRQLTLVLLILVSANAHSQIREIGFRGGTSIANFFSHNASATQFPNNSTEPNDSYYKTNFFKDMQVGFFFGLFVNRELRRKLDLEFGINYCQKGINLRYGYNERVVNPDNSTTNTSYQFTRDLRLNYLVVPAVLRYKLGKKERVYLLGGVYAAKGLTYIINDAFVRIIRETESSSGLLLYSSGSTSWIVDTNAERFDSGLIGGFGMEWPLKNKWRVGFDVRTNIGLISIPQRDLYFFGFSSDAKNINIETGLKLLYSKK